MEFEPNYAFRQNKYRELRKLQRDFQQQPEVGDYILTDGFRIQLDGLAGELLRQAIYDFTQFLLDTMHVSAQMMFGSGTLCDLTICVDSSYKSYRCYRIDTSPEGIRILAHDERGAQQALFHLEFCMEDCHAPFLSCGTVEHEPLFSPRMVHSGYGSGQYPDVHLREIARAGMDAIVISYTDAETSRGNFFDFSDLVFRAARYGLDVYLYSMIRSPYHPATPQAEAFYDAAYGELFRRFPDVKGVILVTESCGIPSADENSTPYNYASNFTDGVPNDKPSADYWPCLDYAEWIRLLKKVIHRQKPEADIIFWTYNFSSAPAEARCRLIEALPDDISLLVTMGNHERIPVGDQCIATADYNLVVAGPGEVFAVEAEAAKKRGIRLYAMSNTGGRTWDFGTVPFEPMPQQWLKRVQALKEAKQTWGLSGLMESHHYGFWPSFISEMMRNWLEAPGCDEEILKKVLRRHFGTESADVVEDALSDWSKAIQHLTPTNEDQYGAFRTGPAYPFNLIDLVNIPASPGENLNGFYTEFYSQDNSGGKSLTGLRIDGEIALLKSGHAGMLSGLQKLSTISNPNDELSSLINLGAYLACCIKTGILAKQWYILRNELITCRDPHVVRQLCDQAEALLTEEKENVTEAIGLVAVDSRLGYEPIMGYVCSEQKLRWKLRQLDFVIHSELRAYRAGTLNGDDYERHTIPYIISRPWLE